MYSARKVHLFLLMQIKAACLFMPFGIKHFYSDDKGAYERKHLTFRARIKRLPRKTICFSKLEKMHDILIGLFINRYEFGLDV